MEFAVLSVSPSAFLPLKIFPARRKGIKMRSGINEEVAFLLIMDQRTRLGIVIGRIADLVLIKPKVVVEKNTDAPLPSGDIKNADAAEEDILVARDGIISLDNDAERCVLKLDGRDECLGLVAKVAFPAGVRRPCKTPVAPNAETRDGPVRMVLLPDVRKIYVANLVLVVEIDEQRTIANGDITHSNL